jgi:hypothetical protein
LIELKIESDTEEILEEARAAAQITVLDDSLADGAQKGAAGQGAAGAAGAKGRASATPGRRSPAAPAH